MPKQSLERKKASFFFFFSEVYLIDKAKMKEKLFLASSEPLISKSPLEQGLSVTEAVVTAEPQIPHIRGKQD